MWIWLIVAIVAAAGEAVTYDLWLASLSVAALIIAIVAVFITVGAIQVGLFAALSLLGIAVVRPIVKHSLGLDSLAHHVGTATQAHIAGKPAVVTRTVTADGGQVRIGQGEFWTARAYDLDETIEVGQLVEIVVVDGVTALVERRPSIAKGADGADRLIAPSEKGR